MVSGPDAGGYWKEWAGAETQRPTPQGYIESSRAKITSSDKDVKEDQGRHPAEALRTNYRAIERTSKRRIHR